MKCQNCGENEANVRYTEIINGVKKEMALCDKCSKELGLQSLDFNIPIDFSSFLGEFLEDNDNLLPNFMKPNELKCDFCGMTFNDFVNGGKLGCANCYDVFESKIDHILKNIHGSNIHTGRKYQLASPNIKRKEEKKEQIENNTKVNSELKKLQEDLKQAIKEERYEEAADIRDEIKKFEK